MSNDGEQRDVWHRDTAKLCVYNVMHRPCLWITDCYDLIEKKKYKGKVKLSEVQSGFIKASISQVVFSEMRWRQVEAQGSRLGWFWWSSEKAGEFQQVVEVWEEETTRTRVSRAELWSQLNCNSQDCSSQSAGKSDRLEKKCWFLLTSSKVSYYTEQIQRECI